MSKPALGRGLASLLQEETDRGTVKAPGLVSWKGAEQPAAGVADPATPDSTTVSTVMPEAAAAESNPGSVSMQAPSQAVSEAPVSAVPEGPVPKPGIPGTPVPQGDDPGIPAEPVGFSPSPLRSSTPAAGSLTGSQSATPPPPSGATVPGWIIPALIAGDVLVVLSGILWASWGRGWGRWPWIAALFAVGCSQALAALFLARSGQRPSGGPFTGRPSTGSGTAPGIRVRFVEEQPQSRRGDRR